MPNHLNRRVQAARMGGLDIEQSTPSKIFWTLIKVALVLMVWAFFLGDIMNLGGI